MKPERKKIKIWKWALSGVIFLLLLEVFIRFSGIYTTLAEKTGGGFISLFSVQHSGLYYTHKGQDTIHIRSKEFSYDHLIDSLGFRNKPNRDFTTYPIVAFGDSFTEGLGAPQDSTWPVLLQNKYNGKPVYNAGIMGSDPAYALKLLQDNYLGFTPETVLFAINYSDITDMAIRGGMSRFQGNEVIYRDEPWFMPAYKHSHLFRAVMHLVFRYDYMFNSACDRKTRIHDAIQETANILSEANDYCTKKNIRMKVFVHPVPQEYYMRLDSRLNFKRVDELVPLLTQNKVDIVNLRPLFEATLKTPQAWKNVSWPVDGHYNGSGYLLMADYIYAQTE